MDKYEIARESAKAAVRAVAARVPPAQLEDAVAAMAGYMVASLYFGEHDDAGADTARGALEGWLGVLGTILERGTGHRFRFQVAHVEPPGGAGDDL